jgi:cytochrome P450
MSDATLRNESATLLLAGHETTATTLMWAFILLAQRPELTDQLAQEAQQVLGDSPTAPTLDQIARLKLAEAVIAETLRLYPAAWLIGREANHRVQLSNEVVISKGGLVFISAYNNHRNPAYFPDPEAFLPERWVDGSLEQRLPKGVYIPFSEGPRVCIGQQFAQFEGRLLLSMIAQRWRLAIHPVERPLPIRGEAVIVPCLPVHATVQALPVEAPSRPDFNKELS